MGNIYFTSDFHFCHNQEFCYGQRGFSSPEEMNKTIISNFNNIITDEDDAYCLGDLMLSDNEGGMAAMASLKGRWHIILGNHDTPTRQELYKTLPNVVEICYATMIKYKKFNFYLSHYPTLTGNIDRKGLWCNVLNLYGHTHQTIPFSFYSPYMYNVGVDAHDCKPVSIEQVLLDMRKNFDKVESCIDKFLIGD